MKPEGEPHLFQHAAQEGAGLREVEAGLGHLMQSPAPLHQLGLQVLGVLLQHKSASSG